MESTDTSLLVRLRDPADAGAWATADRLYRPMLDGYARARGLSQADAEDVAQQCLQAVFQQIKDYPHEGSFRVWLRSIASNRVCDLIAKRRHEVRAGTSFLAGQADANPSPDKLWERAWWTAHLRYCVEAVRQEIAPDTYAAFVGHAIDGEPAEAVAQRLGMTANQVYVAKHRMMKRIRGMLIELAGTDEAEVA